MISIKDILIYPVKSCRGMRLDEAMLSATGFAGDRNWMIVDAAGTFVSQREQPRLALVQPSLATDSLRLAAPNMPNIEVPLVPGGDRLEAELFGEKLPSLTVSEAASAWFSAYLDGSFALVACDPSHARLGGVQYPSRDGAPTSFVDNYGILVISEASRADLNRRLPAAVPMNRFRPNIVIGGVDAYGEDYFSSVKAGDVELRFIDVCYRCNMTTIDQETAVMGDQPLATLARYRTSGQGVRFGSYAAVLAGVGSTLRAGSPLDVTLNF